MNTNKGLRPNLEEIEIEVTESSIKKMEQLANKNCKHCLGTGRQGFVMRDGVRRALLCTAKRCAKAKFLYILQLSKIEKLNKEIEKKKEEENDSGDDSK